MSMGQRIAQKRKEQGLSQEALGDRLGVSRQSIYKWESDSALPEIDKLVALSGLFGVSVGWLLGVEEDTSSPEANPPGNDGELTEAQLKMVEEITERYTAAQLKPKKSVWDKWSVRILFAICGLILGCLLGINGSVKKLEDQYGSLQDNVSHVQISVDRQIGTITSRVEEILKAQNDLTADYGVKFKYALLESNTALFSAYAVPKTYVDGMTVNFSIDNGDGGITVIPGTIGLERKFSAETLACKLTDSIQINAVFTYPDGTQQTQLLESFNGLYTESLPVLYLHDSLMYAEVHDGKLTLDENTAQDPYIRVSGSGSISTSAANEHLPSTVITDIRVGLFKNQKLVAWAEPCKQPATYHGDWSGERFYRLPDLTVSLTPSDLLQSAIVAEDSAGRTFVLSDVPYILDTANENLTWPPSYFHDPDPSHWELE